MIVSQNAENRIKLYIYISPLLPRVEYVYSTTGTSRNNKNKIFEIRNKGHPIKIATIEQK